MRKFVITGLAVVFVLLVSAGTALAAPRVILNGQELVFNVPPVIEQGRTLVPLRVIFEALGANVNWDGRTRTVTATKDGTEIKLIIGGRAYKNNQPVALDVPAKIVNGRTLVPLRFVSEALGAKVNWDAKTQVATIRSFSSAQGLQIVLKDVGFPEVKYLQPTIKEVQLQDESGKWITIWSSPEGKAVKLTPDGAEVVLDTVSVAAATFVGTRLLVSTIDVEADINRDGDTSDKNVEIILTEEEFQSLPQKEKPQAPQKPQAPVEGGQQPPGDQQPPEEPKAPQEPQAPFRIEGGLVYTGDYLDEKHTVTLNDYIVPLFEDKFVYSGSGGKIIYDFTLHPLKPKHEQISVEVFTTTTSNITVPPGGQQPPSTVLLDDFDGATKGKGFGALTYEDSLPNLGKAVNLAKGTYIKYSFSPWYKWDGAHKWDRNEAAAGVLTEGTIEMWIKPRQYSGILTFNWGDAASSPQAGYIMHFGFNADGKLTYSVWGGNLDKGLVGKTTIPLNKWTHVAVSWSPSGTKLYVNGEVDASTSANVWPAFWGTVFAYLNYWGENDLGLVDDLRISRVAEPPIVSPHNHY
jgi:hypothetical protein